jgi:hypothetical protein
MRLPAFSLLLIGFALPAAAETLNIKQGLWEATSTIKTSGVSTLPPEIQQRITPKPQKARRCVTQQNIADVFNKLDSNPACKRTVVTSTAKVQDSTVACSSPTSGTGEVHIEAPDPAHIRGHTSIVVNDMHINVTFEGKWISDDCGDMKPTP